MKPLPNEHARDWVARMLALHGLGTINGADRLQPPTPEWDETEWQRRVLECIPTDAELKCRNLASEIFERLTTPSGERLP